jgi:hypothetical protein
VAPLLLGGEADLRLGAREPEFDFFSSLLSELWTLPALEGGRLSSTFLLSTVVSYGLKARPPAPRAGSAGLARATGALSALWPAPVGGVAAELSLTAAGFFGFSNGGINGLVLGVSAPIWLQVCASKANGLFFASSCNKAHGIPILHYKCDETPACVNTFKLPKTGRAPPTTIIIKNIAPEVKLMRLNIIEPTEMTRSEVLTAMKVQMYGNRTWRRKNALANKLIEK